MADNVKRVIKELAGRLKAARQAAGLSQEALAHKSGIPYRRVQLLESGTSNTTVRTLVRVADALGVEFADLVSGKAGDSRRS